MRAGRSDLVDEIAERDLLGALIIAGKREDINRVDAGLFGTQLHRNIASAVLHLIEQGITIDYLEVLNEMQHRSQNPSIAYLIALGTGVVLGRPIARRIAHLQELAERRRLVKLADQIAADASNLAVPIDEIKAMLMEAVR